MFVLWWMFVFMHLRSVARVLPMNKWQHILSSTWRTHSHITHAAWWRKVPQFKCSSALSHVRWMRALVSTFFDGALLENGVANEMNAEQRLNKLKKIGNKKSRRLRDAIKDTIYMYLFWNERRRNLSMSTRAVLRGGVLRAAASDQNHSWIKALVVALMDWFEVYESSLRNDCYVH